MKEDDWYMKKTQNRELILMPGMLQKRVSFCSDIRITIQESNFNQNVHENVIDMIIGLPSEFDNKKLSLIVEYENRIKMLNLDKVCRAVAKQKPNLIFKEFCASIVCRIHLGPSAGQDV